MSIKPVNVAAATLPVAIAAEPRRERRVSCDMSTGAPEGPTTSPCKPQASRLSEGASLTGRATRYRQQVSRHPARLFAPCVVAPVAPGCRGHQNTEGSGRRVDRSLLLTGCHHKGRKPRGEVGVHPVSDRLPPRGYEIARSRPTMLSNLTIYRDVQVASIRSPHSHKTHRARCGFLGRDVLSASRSFNAIRPASVASQRYAAKRRSAIGGLWWVLPTRRSEAHAGLTEGQSFRPQRALRQILYLARGRHPHRGLTPPAYPATGSQRAAITMISS